MANCTAKSENSDKEKSSLLCPKEGMQVFIAWKEEFFWFLTVAPNSKAACGKGLPQRALCGGRAGTSRAIRGATTSAPKLSWGCISPAVTDLFLPGPELPAQAHQLAQAGDVSPHCAAGNTHRSLQGPTQRLQPKRVRSILQGTILG